MTGGGSVVTTTRSSIAPNNSRKSTVSNAVSETSIALQYDDRTYKFRMIMLQGAFLVSLLS